MNAHESVYETRDQVVADVAEVYEQARTINVRGALTDLNHARLLDVCKAAGVYLGAFDHRILRWLAGWEPETVQVLVSIIGRANREA